MSLQSDLFRGKSPLLVGLGVILVAETVGICYLLYRSHTQQQTLTAAEAELEKQVKLRANERIGRISAQQANRDEKNKQLEVSGYHYHPIGHIESPFPDRRGTPRQPVLVPAARGKIRFDKKIIQNEHFKELSQFSHVWVVFVFHNNTNTEKQNQIAKIKPPRLHGAKVGCLSTRSPHRPNNIGLSVCEVVGTGSDYIELRCVDMVDGTPVLDVKPYIPYDVVPSQYVLPMATSADGTALPARLLEVPDWVVDADIPMLPVVIPADVLQSLEEGLSAKSRIKRTSCQSVSDAVELITQVLRQDIRGVHQGRGTTSAVDSASSAPGVVVASSPYQCSLDNMDIEFTTTPQGILVSSVVFDRK